MPEALDFQGVSVTRLAARMWPAPTSRNTMTDVKMRVLPTKDWNSSLSHVIADMKGMPLNVHKLLANNPALLDAWWSFRNYLVQGGSLGKRNAELVILRTAAHARNWYEWASHVERGLMSNLSLTEIERVLEGPSHPDWPESDALLLQSVDELAKNGALGPELLDKMNAHIGQAAILDLISDGRVEFGTGRSSTKIELEGFGVHPNDTREMWREAVEHILTCWTEEYAEFEGKHWSLPRRRVQPKPLQKPHPPVWGATGSPSQKFPHESAGIRG